MKRIEQENGASGERLSERIRNRYTGVSRSEMIMLAGDRRLTVRGCGKILAFAPEEIRIAMRRRILLITGNDLRCFSFSGGCVTVEGKVKALSFSTGGDEET